MSNNISSLKALAASITPKKEGDIGAKRGDFYSFPLDLFEEQPGFNPRNYDNPKTKAHIEKLAQAYMAGQMLPPLIVQVVDGRLIVRAGHCRRLGARLARERGAQILRLSCIEMKGDVNEQDALLVTSQDSLDLSPIQRARVYMRYINRGMSPDEAGVYVNKSGKHIKEELELLALPDELQALVEDDVVKPYLARKLFKVHGGEKALNMVLAQIAALESEDENDPQQPLVPGATATPKNRRVTEKQFKNVMPLTIKKSFAQTMFNGFSSLRQHVKDAQPDATDGTIQLKLPADIFAQLDTILAEVEKLKAKQLAPKTDGTEEGTNDDNQQQLAV
ncbi:hypothetical protein BLL42_27350 (plasmid) [Pseudomonas frederiksbergensis]|uniref:ParB/Spo0J HTH domain-containing protein n=1 Tax=Pseudomonas frederiksbergensis TaxID=104087 RepID=A0A1J0ETY5_9PSED|nr:hypothetical protein [Pseudomonas frederiksbergensis]APC19454.1 hypothetical protein BLL42_27350 [Pseudomonas frederiksbergensis]